MLLLGFTLERGLQNGAGILVESCFVFFGSNLSPSGPSGDVSVALHILDIEKALKI